VEITYVNELKADIGGEGVLVILPTSIAPRYGVPPAEMLSSSAKVENGLHVAVHVHAMIPLRKLESRTHPISVEMGTTDTAGSPAVVSNFSGLVGATKESNQKYDPRKAKAILSERHATLGRDFVLMILSAGSSMLASEARLEEAPTAGMQSAMQLTLNPRDLFSSYVEPESFNGEIVFIADRSGSMGGPKMDTLKNALNLSLRSLTGKVYFNIYSFGSKFSSLWSQSELCTDYNVGLAAQYVSNFTASMGGTEILSAMTEAVQKRKIRDNFSTQIIILTDGRVWEEAAVRQYVQLTRAESKDAIRFFALGIGNAVSHRLIEGIGTQGGGFAEVVGVDSGERWEGRVVRMLKGAFMPESYKCEIELNGKSTTAICSVEGSSFMQAPYTVSALHPFSRVTMYFLLDRKYGTDLSTIRLKTSTPSREQISVDLPVTKVTTSVHSIHYLAAKAIILDLETGKSWIHGTIGNEKAADAAAKDLGEQLAIKYHMISKWTSFVAVEKGRHEYYAGRLYKAPHGDLKSRTVHIAQVAQGTKPGILGLSDVQSYPYPQPALMSSYGPTSPSIGGSAREGSGLGTLTLGDERHSSRMAPDSHIRPAYAPTVNYNTLQQVFTSHQIQAAPDLMHLAYLEEEEEETNPPILTLQNLVSVQSGQGAFDLPPYLFQELCRHFKALTVDRLENMLSSNGEDFKARLGSRTKLLLYTLLVVVWLESACTDETRSYEMLARKAKTAWWVSMIVGDEKIEEMLWKFARSQWLGSAK
jgi:Mg-chelatase subunit ChlD